MCHCPTFVKLKKNSVFKDISMLISIHRLKEEVDEVIGMKQEISNEDLGNMPYLTQVIYFVSFGSSLSRLRIIIYNVYVCNDTDWQKR